jgi:hypothetical protein
MIKSTNMPVVESQSDRLGVIDLLWKEKTKIDGEPEEKNHIHTPKPTEELEMQTDKEAPEKSKDNIVTAKVFSKDKYTWYKHGGNTRKFTTKNGLRNVVLNKGSVFGLRPATSKKGHTRMITPEHGESIVFTHTNRVAHGLVKTASLTNHSAGKKKK